jgi:hypothetical protein
MSAKFKRLRAEVRFVEVRGTRYLRAEDVEDLIRELGSGEETDVRKRLEEAVARLQEARRKRG